jgi:hypothetical protein
MMSVVGIYVHCGGTWEGTCWSVSVYPWTEVPEVDRWRPRQRE